MGENKKTDTEMSTEAVRRRGRLEVDVRRYIKVRGCFTVAHVTQEGAPAFRGSFQLIASAVCQSCLATERRNNRYFRALNTLYVNVS